MATIENICLAQVSGEQNSMRALAGRRECTPLLSTHILPCHAHNVTKCVIHPAHASILYNVIKITPILIARSLVYSQCHSIRELHDPGVTGTRGPSCILYT